MNEEALFRAHPGRLWIAVLPLLTGCIGAAAASALGVISLPLLPFTCAAMLLACLFGLLVARNLPGRRALALRADGVRSR